MSLNKECCSPCWCTAFTYLLIAVNILFQSNMLQGLAKGRVITKFKIIQRVASTLLPYFFFTVFSFRTFPNTPSAIILKKLSIQFSSHPSFSPKVFFQLGLFILSFFYQQSFARRSFSTLRFFNSSLSHHCFSPWVVFRICLFVLSPYASVFSFIKFFSYFPFQIFSLTAFSTLWTKN